MRYLGYGLLILLFINGCTGTRSIPIIEDENETNGTRYAYTYTPSSAGYRLKPEPYSLTSNKKDPELLGPQTTIKKVDNNATQKEIKEAARPLPVNTKVLTKEEKPKEEKPKTAAPSISKGECISMIGQEKFDQYSAKLGSEAAVLKRCIVLKKLKRR